jgi:OOP family OmpA-OmpF porin
MLNKSVIAVVGLTAAAFALPASAQMRSPAMSSFYVGATLGQSKFKDSCEGLAAGVSCDDKDTAWRILAGYQFSPNFAAELGYHNLGETKASGGGVSASVKGTAWELVGLGIFPVANQFGIYGKLGFHHSEAKLESNVGITGKDTGNGLTFGFGGQFDVMPALGLRAEWQRYRKLGGESDNGDVDVLSLGGIWRFR